MPTAVPLKPLPDRSIVSGTASEGRPASVV
jgi:hypothetical protein